MDKKENHIKNNISNVVCGLMYIKQWVFEMKEIVNHTALSNTQGLRVNHDSVGGTFFLVWRGFGGGGGFGRPVGVRVELLG